MSEWEECVVDAISVAISVWFQGSGVESESGECACCDAGYCRCPSRENTCVPCTELSVAACEQHSQ